MVSSDHIKPGERGLISVKVAVTSEGPVIKTVEVKSNDPARPGVVLVVRAFVGKPPPPAQITNSGNQP